MYLLLGEYFCGVLLDTVISCVYDAVPMVVWLYCAYALYGFNGFSLGCNAGISLMLELVDNPVGSSIDGC